MEQRRFLLFLSLSLLIWIGWTSFVMPKFFPQPPKPAKNPGGNAAAQLHADEAPADALRVENAVVDLPKIEKPGVPKHPPQTVKLGSLKLDSDFFMEVELTSFGAAVRSVRLNDYPTFKKRDQPLEVIGSDAKPGEPLTFATAIPELDVQLPPGGNAELNWELLPDSVTDRTAAFRMVSPDGSLEVVKRYELKVPPPGDLAQPKARHRLFEGYNLYLTIELNNRENEVVAIEYQLQGPVGTPLEDEENSSKYRDIRMAFFDKNGQIQREQMTASEVVDKATPKKDQEAAPKIETWTAPLKYIGVDVKYFAGLVEPLNDQIKQQTVIGARAQLVRPGREEQYSEISVTLDAKADVPARGNVTHEYRLFAGPKRQELLTGMQAQEIVDFGYVTPIAKGMLWMLNVFHDYLHVNYGIAIILLTVVVRLCMMPLSLHQAHNMQRMKELQPKIKELQAKHKDQKEELARAQMELFRKHNYNPLSGCLPLFLQLPIFIGLYTALSGAVDLRMAKFLWIDNLASPDALFPLGFVVPFLGWTDFNLLPIISTGLMFFQQKMMMPPPADEEQAMQQKMMNYMMIFMGAMFYRVPAGLCLYFIASSVWGMVERWVINRISKKKQALTTSLPAADAAAPPSPPRAERSGGSNSASRLGEMWSKLQQAADKDTSITRADANGNGPSRGGKKKKR